MATNVSCIPASDSSLCLLMLWILRIAASRSVAALPDAMPTPASGTVRPIVSPIPMFRICWPVLVSMFLAPVNPVARPETSAPIRAKSDAISVPICLTHSLFTTNKKGHDSHDCYSSQSWKSWPRYQNSRWRSCQPFIVSVASQRIVRRQMF